MADEISISITLNIRKGNLLVNAAKFFLDSMIGKSGPSPGSIIVTQYGVDVAFPGLISPGWILLENLENSGWVEVGIKEPDTNYFYPMIELLPGKPCIFRLSRNLFREYQSTGTGTSVGSANTLHMKARDIATASVVVSAYDR